MTLPFRIDRIFGDRPCAETGDPVLALADERRRLLAVAGEYEFGGTAPVGVYGTDDLKCRALLRVPHRVHAMAFHPVLPLLAVGTGHYDGGYFFEGELLLLDLETGGATSLFEHYLGRQVLGLEWLDAHELRVLMAPSDDWQDSGAHVEGHVAVLRRSDWRAVPASSITHADLVGPRVPAPRPDGRDDARRTLSVLGGPWDARRNVRAVEELGDGRLLAALDGVALESWLPSGERQWAVPDDGGGRDMVVAHDERAAWVRLDRPPWGRRPPYVVMLSLEDGTTLDHLVPKVPVSLVRCADGLPALAPTGSIGKRGMLRVRRGRRVYFRAQAHKKNGPRPEGQAWFAAADLEETPVAGRPWEPANNTVGRLFPYSWVPGETHFAGPGVETADGDLVHAGTVYNGHGLQPGGSFVVRRGTEDGKPAWVFRTDRPATDLDAGAETVHVGYDDGEIVGLDLRDGTVLWRGHLTVGAVSVVPTALTVVGPGRLLIGTDDGRVLRCSHPGRASA